MKCSDNHTFENWGQTLSFKPKRFCQPESVQDVIDIVQQARAAGSHVRIQGAERSHSWSQFVLTNDTLVNLDKLNKPLVADILKQQYTVQAGIRIKDLVKVLALDGLGMRNLGSIMEQSIAGAVSTGTHGTGLRIGSIATQIVKLKLVNGKGEVVEISEADMAHLRAARVNVGALGIIVEVTIQCVANYDLEFSAYWCRFEDVTDIIPALNAENERVRIWWFPKPLLGLRHDVVITTMNPPNSPRGTLGAFENLTGSPGNKMGSSNLPLDIEVLFTALGKLAVKPDSSVLLSRFTANYVQVLTLPLPFILHRECEYAIPVENTRDALVRLKQIMDEGDFSTTLPFEVRFVAGDDSLLSPTHGRGVCYIGANTMENANEIFQRFEPLMKSLDGRPHWGKHFTMTREEIVKLYGGSHAEFTGIRAKFDPDNVFGNSLIHELFD